MGGQQLLNRLFLTSDGLSGARTRAQSKRRLLLLLECLPESHLLSSSLRKERLLGLSRPKSTATSTPQDDSNKCNHRDHLPYETTTIDELRVNHCFVLLHVEPSDFVMEKSVRANSRSGTAEIPDRETESTSKIRKRDKRDTIWGRIFRRCRLLKYIRKAKNTNSR